MKSGCSGMRLALVEYARRNSRDFNGLNALGRTNTELKKAPSALRTAVLQIESEYSLSSREPEKEIFPSTGGTRHRLRSILRSRERERSARRQSSIKPISYTSFRASQRKQGSEQCIDGRSRADCNSEAINKSAVAPARLLAQKPPIMPIPGTTKMQRMLSRD